MRPDRPGSDCWSYVVSFGVSSNVCPVLLITYTPLSGAGEIVPLMNGPPL